MHCIRITTALVLIIALAQLKLATCFAIKEQDCKVKKVFYSYNYKVNGIECNAQIPVNACQGQCLTGYNLKTGRTCSACQPTDIALAATEVDCYHGDIKLKKIVHMASALGCKCMKWKCGHREKN